MGIRIRVRGPGGASTLTTEDDWTLEQLVALIKEKMGVSDFGLMSGFPPVPLDLRAKDTPLADLKLNGATLTLTVAEKLDDVRPTSTSSTKAAQPLPSFKPKRVAPDETAVEWQERGGYLVLRVMPDDNNCLFTSFGGVMGIPDPAKPVRKAVAEHILKNSDKYSKVVLENTDPAVYAARIQDPQRWGGSIELECLSEIYDIQICSIDVKYGRIDTYGLDKKSKCILVYSGIHYDRIVHSFDLGYSAELDVTRWDADDDAVLEKAKELAAQLKSASYYTDTHTMAIKCEVPGCENWLGAGEKDMAKHQAETGHAAFAEMDIE